MDNLESFSKMFSPSIEKFYNSLNLDSVSNSDKKYYRISLEYF